MKACPDYVVDGVGGLDFECGCVSTGLLLCGDLCSGGLDVEKYSQEI